METQTSLHEIESIARKEMDGLIPYLYSKVCQFFDIYSIIIDGSLEAKDSWACGCWENSHYFRFDLTTKGNAPYKAGEHITANLIRRRYDLPKFRKYTGTPEKVIAKIKKWIIETSQLDLSHDRF